MPARPAPLGHVLLCHGNGGNIGDRVAHAELLVGAGFDVLRSTTAATAAAAGGRASRAPTATRGRRVAALLRRDGVDATRVFYLGESLGGAVALELALEHPPAGLILQSTFTSVRDMARVHYPFIPAPRCPTRTRACG